MTKFSPKLVEEIKKYFADKYGAELSDEQAEMYLDSLGGLWSIVAKGK